MTAVCLKAKSTVETDTWSSTFTNFNTDTKSCLFIKQLTRACISTILHLRKVLPDDFFETKNFEGMTLKLLKPRKEENFVSKIELWLEGAFEAIEKKYLKRLMLDIQDAKTNMTLEIYTMSFSYNKENEMLKHFFSTTANRNRDFTATNIKSSTLKIFQMFYAVSQTYGSLPFQVKLSMRLSYYENTPENYQPNGYMLWEPVDAEFLKQARSIEIGKTGTQHHFFKLLNKSCLNDKFFKGIKDQCEESHSTALFEHSKNFHKLENFAQERPTKAKKELCFDNHSKSIDTSLLIPSKNKDESKFLVTEKCLPALKSHDDLLNSVKHKKARRTTNKNINALNNISAIKDTKVRCACLSNNRSEAMFRCLGCKFVVHAECFGILQFDSSKKVRFYCHLCHQLENNFKCHDKVIISLKSSSDQQKLSILRRVLRHCTLPKVTTITLRKMEKIAGSNCSKSVVNIVLNKMIEIGVAVPQGKKKNHLIDKHELANRLVHYFYKVQNSPPNHSQVPTSIKKPSNSTRQEEVDELVFNKETKHSTVAIQEFFRCNNHTSQQSCDIFCRQN